MRINELARVIPSRAKLGTHFQSAALPTELPGRDYAAEELSGLPDAVGVSLFAVICPFVCRC